MDKTYTVKQVADMLGYSTNSIYTFLKEGQIVGIRIGKGRYRVTQDELSKILHLKKSQNISLSAGLSTTNLKQSATEAIKPQTKEVIPSLNRHLGKIKENMPSLFDWFISLISIILGFTMILFVRNFEEFSGTKFSQFFLPLKINFLAAGLGLFAINFIGKDGKKWSNIFYLILLVNFIAYSLILLLGKDLWGGFFFVFASIIMIFHRILNLKGTISFNTLISVLTICSPLMLLFFPDTIDHTEFIKITGLSTNAIILIWSILVIIINTVVWLSKKEKKLFYWISFFMVCLGFGFFSYQYSIQLYWSRALVYMLITLFVLLSSFWNDINQNDEENKRIIKSIFCGIILIFIVFVCIIWIIQNNIKNYAQEELINKLHYGQNFVESSRVSSQEALETISKSGLLIDAIKKNNTNDFNNYIKNIFIFSKNFRRILLADKNGDLLSIYPYTDVGYTNISFRDYFENTKTNKRSYLSNVFQVQSDGVKRFVVTINVPILDENKDFIGIIIGSLDVDAISNKLKQISNVENGEYFLIIDGQGNLILQTDDINKLNSDELTQLKLNNNLHPEEALDFENKLIQIHNKINETNWTIAIRKPLINIYKFDNSIGLIFCLIILGSGLLIIFFNLIYLIKSQRD